MSKCSRTLFVVLTTVAFAQSFALSATDRRYRNEQLGYEFIVPSDFNAPDTGDCNLNQMCSQNISHVENKENWITVRTWKVIEGGTCKLDPIYWLEPQKRTINGIQFLRYEMIDQAAGSKTHQVWYIAQRDGLCHSVEIISDLDYQEPVYFQKMVKSFRFVKRINRKGAAQPAAAPDASRR